MTSKQAWVLGLASLASFMMALDSLVVTTTLGTIRQDLTASVESLEWTVNAYNLTFAVLLLTGLLLQTVGSGWIAVVADTDTGYLELLPALIIGGVGLTMAMPAAQKAVVGAVQPREIGQASGAFMMLRILGGVFGVAVSVAVFAGVGGYASAEEFSAGFAAAMGAVAAFAFIGMLVALGMPGSRPTTITAPQATTAVHQRESAES